MMIEIGDSVRVLAPFNVGSSDVYQVVAYSADNDAYLLSNGVEFVPEYLEKI